MRVEILNPSQSLTSKRQLQTSRIYCNIRERLSLPFPMFLIEKAEQGTRSRGQAEKKEEIEKRGRVCKREEKQAR